MGTSIDQTSGGPLAPITNNTGGNIVFDVGATYRTYQLCMDENGYAYNDYSHGWSNQVGWIDFGWTKPMTMTSREYWGDGSSTYPGYLVNIDPGTGEWSVMLGMKLWVGFGLIGIVLLVVTLQIEWLLM